MSIPKRSSSVRRWVHFGFGAIAFALPALTRPWAIGVAASAAIYNGLLAPRMGWDRAYRRQGEPWYGGLFTYALAVLILVFYMPNLLAAAVGWLVLASCDPAAAWIGSRAGGPAIPWCPRKSVAGSVAALVVGGLAVSLLTFVWDGPWRPAWIAVAVGVTIESLPWNDDNLPIALGSGWMYVWATGALGAG